MLRYGVVFLNEKTVAHTCVFGWVHQYHNSACMWRDSNANFYGHRHIYTNSNSNSNFYGHRHIYTNSNTYANRYANSRWAYSLHDAEPLSCVSVS